MLINEMNGPHAASQDKRLPPTSNATMQARWLHAGSRKGTIRLPNHCYQGAHAGTLGAVLAIRHCLTTDLQRTCNK